MKSIQPQEWTLALLLIASTVLFPFQLFANVYPFQGLILASFIAILTIQNVYTKRLKIPKDYYTAFFFLFCVIIPLSGLWAHNLSLVWSKSAFWLVLFTLYVNIRSLDTNAFNHTFWRRLFFTIIVANIILVVFSFYLIAFNESGDFYLSNRKILESSRFFFTNGNQITSLLVLVFPFLLLFTEDKKVNKIILTLCIALLAYLILIYNSRASSIALVLIGLMYLIRFVKTTKSFLVILIFILLAISFVFGAYFLIDDPSNYFEQYNPFNTVLKNTPDDRLYIWRNSFQLFSEYPVLGVGSGNWIIEISKYGSNDFLGEESYRQAHNFIIESFSELGVIGGLLTFLLVAHPLIKFFRSKISNKFLFYTTLSLIGFVIVSSFYGVVYLTYKIMCIWTIIVALFYNQFETQKTKMPIVGIVLMLIMFLLSSLYTAYQNIAIYKYRMLTDKNIEKEQKANLIDEIYFPNVYEFHEGDHLHVRRVQYIEATDNEFAIELLENALIKHPNHFKANHELGLRYEKQKLYSKALQSYKRAIELNQRHIVSHLGILRISNVNEFWDEFENGNHIFENTLIPTFDDHYLGDESLRSRDKKVRKFWQERCRYLDSYYQILDKRNRILKARQQRLKRRKSKQ